MAGDAAPDADLARAEGAGDPDGSRIRRAAVPAGVAACRALNDDYDGAKALASWKARVREAWQGVTIEHVESSSGADAFEMGQSLQLRAFVSLGSLSPDDVDVQVVHGLVDESDQLREPQVSSLEVADKYENGRFRFDGEVSLAAHRPVRVHGPGGAPPRPAGRRHRARPGGPPRRFAHPSWLMLAHGEYHDVARSNRPLRAGIVTASPALWRSCGVRAPAVSRATS